MMDISLISSGISLLFKKTIISTYNNVNESFLQHAGFSINYVIIFLGVLLYFYFLSKRLDNNSSQF